MFELRLIDANESMSKSNERLDEEARRLLN